jgi:hypothetical protein
MKKIFLLCFIFLISLFSSDCSSGAVDLKSLYSSQPHFSLSKLNDSHVCIRDFSISSFVPDPLFFASKGLFSYFESESIVSSRDNITNIHSKLDIHKASSKTALSTHNKPVISSKLPTAKDSSTHSRVSPVLKTKELVLRFPIGFSLYLTNAKNSRSLITADCLYSKNSFRDCVIPGVSIVDEQILPPVSSHVKSLPTPKISHTVSQKILSVTPAPKITLPVAPLPLDPVSSPPITPALVFNPVGKILSYYQFHNSSSVVVFMSFNGSSFSSEIDKTKFDSFSVGVGRSVEVSCKNQSVPNDYSSCRVVSVY